MREDPEWIVHPPAHLCGVEPLFGGDDQNYTEPPDSQHIVLVGVVPFITDDGVFRPEDLAPLELGKHRRMRRRGCPHRLRSSALVSATNRSSVLRMRNRYTAPAEGTWSIWANRRRSVRRWSSSTNHVGVLRGEECDEQHWKWLRTTNMMERVNRELKRRTNVVGVFPNEESLLRLAGSILMDINEERIISRRYLTMEEE